ncbi:MAG: molybdopterin-synthase adenylyltransferase MoeB [Crocinitomicaceae bacterium]
MLNSEEIKRYARHLSLENVGLKGQERLKSAKILVIGAGGLGAPILQYLTAAGVGTIGIVDHDVVDESNLQRQVIFSISDLGKPKVKAAIDRLQQLNSFVQFQAHQMALDTSSALELLREYDIILDGTDNFPTRYLVNDACVLLNKPFVHGSIFKFQGQVSVFNYQNGPSYRCLYPTAPGAEEAPNCSEVGVLGILPGVIGTRMATECIKMILGVGSVLSGTVEVIDLLENQNVQLKVQRNEANFRRTELESSYDEVCENKEGLEAEISVTELKQRMDRQENPLILDVREPFELEICSFEGALHIPLQSLPTQMAEIPKDTPVIAVCHHGIRSANAIAFLKDQGWTNLSNLEGGIHAWAVEIDPNMAQY